MKQSLRRRQARTDSAFQRGALAGEYVRGRVHTNTIEGFWSLFKRGIVGTFHHIGTNISQVRGRIAFRYSSRHVSDGTRAEQIFKNGEASG